MKDYEVYSDGKVLKAVVINRVLFRYVRPDTIYNRSEIIPVGKPITKRSHAEARKAADEWVVRSTDRIE